jgi:hypothetical protein
MENNLRPLTLGEILDRTAQLYRTNFLLFAGIFSIYAGAMLVLNLMQIGLAELLKSLHMTGALIWVNMGAGGLTILVAFLLIGAATAAISRAVAWVHLGEPASIRRAYQSILPHFGRYLWLMTITALKVWTPFVLLYAGLLGTVAFYGGFKHASAPNMAAGTSPQTAVFFLVAMVVFFVLLIPVGIYTILMSLRYSLAVPACVVEDLKARKAIRRSIALAKGSWGRIFMLALLVGILKLVLVGMTQIFVFVAAFKHSGQPLGPVAQSISQIITFFTTSFLGPIWAAGITLFYYDQRIRKEGFDIEWMMQAAGLTVPEPTAVAGPLQALDAHFDSPEATGAVNFTGQAAVTGEAVAPAEAGKEQV